MSEYTIVGCDWKSPVDLVNGLIHSLPKLGLYAYEIGGGDSFTVLISKTELTPDEIQDIKENE